MNVYTFPKGLNSDFNQNMFKKQNTIFKEIYNKIERFHWKFKIYSIAYQTLHKIFVFIYIGLQCYSRLFAIHTRGISPSKRQKSIRAKLAF